MLVVPKVVQPWVPCKMLAGVFGLDVKIIGGLMAKQIRTIVIEIRRPANKSEAACDGVTYDHGHIANVFLDSRLRRTDKFAETFFHEMMHVFVNFSGRGTIPREEAKAAKLGRAAKHILYGR